MATLIVLVKVIFLFHKLAISKFLNYLKHLYSSPNSKLIAHGKISWMNHITLLKREIHEQSEIAMFTLEPCYNLVFLKLQ